MKPEKMETVWQRRKRHVEVHLWIELMRKETVTIRRIAAAAVASNGESAGASRGLAF